MLRHLLQVFLFIVLLAVTSHAAERPRVALVLGGGGARGLAHVGVLKVLEEAHIPVDCVVGTSMGALVGGVYASGQSAAALSRAVGAIRWNEVLDDLPARRDRSYADKQDDWLNMFSLGLGVSDKGQLLLPKGAIGTQKVDLLIRELVNNATIETFDSLPLPYRAVAADLETGDMVVLSRGDLAAAMRASMAVPGLFPPVERDTRVLVDGGIARNLPIDVARGVCGDVVIAVDVGSPLLTRKQTQDAISISDQAVRALMQRNVDQQLQQLSKRDVLIQPKLGAMAAAAFGEADQAIAAGEAAARAALPALSKLVVDDAQFQAWRAQLAARQVKPLNIAAVTVEPTRFVNPDVLKEALDIEIGKPLVPAQFHQKLASAYATGDFDQIDYRLHPDPQGTTLELLPHEKSWGPGYLDLGLRVRTDFEDDAAYQLTAQFRRKWLNTLGGEWKTRAYIGKARGLETSLYQPLNLDGSLFAAAGIELVNDTFPIFFEGTHIADYRFSRRTAHLDGGWAFGRFGEARFYLSASKVSSTRTTGDPDFFGEGNALERGVGMSLAYDQLDSARYPREGFYARLNAYRNDRNLGATVDYTTAQLMLKKATRVGDWAALLDFQYDYSVNATANAIPSAGGLFKLSSYAIDEIRAARIGRAQFRLSQDVAKLTPLLGTAGFWGVSLEAAKVAGQVNALTDKSGLRFSSALFVGSDTRLGPAYLGIAYGDNRRVRAYLSVNGDF